MKTVMAPLECAKEIDSLCFRCRYYDYAISIGAENGWGHICNSAGEYTPGDNVVECLGFKEDKS